MGQTRINYLRVFTSFFNFARTRRLIEFNPRDKNAIKRPKLDESLPAVFTVKEVECLLYTASDKASAIVPYLAIGFFAGIRTAELERTNWQDIDFSAKLITVRPEVAEKWRQRPKNFPRNPGLRRCIAQLLVRQFDPCPVRARCLFGHAQPSTCAASPRAPLAREPAVSWRNSWLGTMGRRSITWSKR